VERLFVTLSEAMAGAPAVALSAAFAWGVLSIILSPCHLASIPLIVGFLQGGRQEGPIPIWRAGGLSLLFATGILFSIAIVGAVTTAAGRLMGDVGPWGIWFVAAVFIVFGLHLMDLLPLPDGMALRPSVAKRGPWGAFVFGLVFGIALGPCTFGFMAPVLGMTLGLAANSPIYAYGLLALFGLGHCTVIAAAGASSAWVEHPGAQWLRRVCGALVLAAGVWFVASIR